MSSRRRTSRRIGCVRSCSLPSLRRRRAHRAGSQRRDRDGVVQRTREIGIRAALGANASSLLRLVLWQGLTIIGVGLAIGVGGAIAVLCVLRTFLYGVEATDPTTLAAVAFVMTIVAIVACYLPARRATTADPLIALKTE